MPGSGNTTVPVSGDDTSPPPSGTRLLLVLVLAWSADQPERVGEVAFLDGAERSEWVLVRAPVAEGDPGPRLIFVRQGPGGSIDGGPLVGKTISHEQLRFRLMAGGLEVTNIGKATLVVDGHRVDEGKSRILRAGSVLLLLGHSVFLLTLRPRAVAPAGHHAGARHDFGEADADGILGESPAAWAFRAEIASAVLAGGHVLMLGPTGTGKELAARAIHRQSGRRGRFVAFNAATLTDSLADSILFGNVANYPNHGLPARPGLLGEAEGGTLFLDEFGHLPIETQARLLRALEGESTRLGDAMPHRIDVLVVVATNTDRSAIKHDLQKRFSFVLQTPTLVSRIEDVPLLARSLILGLSRKNKKLVAPFLRPGAGGRPEVDLAPALVLALLGLSYDGNVRDLRNLLIRAMTDKRDPPLMPPQDMTPWLPPPAAPGSGPGLGAVLAGLTARGPRPRREPPSPERIVATLEKHHGHRERTAADLGLNRFELGRLMKKYGIRWPP